jgi:predicted metal-dependent phosphoesterase TrpH
MIDLHSHSTVSDGSESPEHVVELAAAAGCTAVALTDHDSTDGVARAAARAGQLGIELVAGCEVSCSATGTMHVLCYFVGDGRSPLQDELARLRDDRAVRNVEMARRLGELGLPVAIEEVTAEAGGVGVGRPHFAAVLVRNGAASSVQDAFDRYLAKGKPGYVPKARVDAASILDLATRSGGVASLAHPLSLGLEPTALARELQHLAELGLVGLECYYGRYDPATRGELVALADRLGLVATGGSDFHGTYKPDLSMGTGTGDLDVPDRVVAELESRRP